MEKKYLVELDEGIEDEHVVKIISDSIEEAKQQNVLLLQVDVSRFIDSFL